MKSLDRQVQPAGNPRHRLRRIGFPQNRLQHLSHLARRDAAQKSLPHPLVHRLLTPLVAAQYLARTAAPRARHPQAAHQPQPRPQLSPVVSVAIIAPPRFVPHVAPHPPANPSAPPPGLPPTAASLPPAPAHSVLLQRKLFSPPSKA